MSTQPQPVQPQRKGFFSMLGTLWNTTEAIVEKSGSVIVKTLDSADELATTAHKHAKHIRMSTEVELDAELKALESQLSS